MGELEEQRLLQVRPSLSLCGRRFVSVTVAGAALSSRAADWRPLWLFIALAVLGVLGDRVHAYAGRMRLLAGSTIVALAMALLGPARRLSLVP